MPAYSTLDLICEVNEAIASLSSSQFTLTELVQIINDNRRKRNIKRKASSESVNRILTRLWLPLNIRKISTDVWEKGTGPIRGITNVRPDVVEKVIRYAKITATPQEIDKWISLGEEPTTRKAYICYPYRDNPLRRSMELLVLLIYLYPKAREKFVPAIPHEMYWGLEQRTSRAVAMGECEKLIKACDFLLNCLKKGETPSSGMQRDMEAAKREGKEIKYIEDYLEHYPNVTDVLTSCGLIEFSGYIDIKKVTPATVTSQISKKF
jgi:hypothetical protein